MKKIIKNPRIIWYALLIGFSLILVSLWQINVIIKKLRHEETKQVEIWAKAISRKANMLKDTKELYSKTLEIERIKMQRFIEAYKIIISLDENADLTSPDLQFYTRIIMDNKTIPVIITDEFNNIQFSQNIDIPQGEKVLVGDLYKKFSRNKPLEYEVYGMKFKLYYTESNIYTNLKATIDEVMSSFISDIINNGVSVPVIITDSKKEKVLAYGNISPERLCKRNLPTTINSMLSDGEPIRISLPNNSYGYIFFNKSKIISVLQFFPWIYLFFLILFAGLLYLVLKAIKTSEQNIVWVGMSKETAHQLGTPISSLSAWSELLKNNQENTSICKEMDKDIERLSVISQRFSHIGSNPDLKPTDIVPVIVNMVDYMSARSSKNILFNSNIEENLSIIIPLNQFLIEWTFENLFKNAIDAMDGKGEISIILQNEDKKIFIDITDTGKGIPKTMYKKIFQPGFTTKKRGWGLGLSLVRRIVEEYHNGKIYVKNSVVGQGTTFRIELKK
ncbi:MAG: HAMP domain-containing sensor histidine kinase [Bacteroidota bacterium]|nr:HAMP domain-containing sensor histidine kinase [Bacteroidota bacterium]